MSLIPSLHVQVVNVALSGIPTDTGVATIYMLPLEFVCTLVYQVSVTPLASGRENLAPVEVCSSAQNGSVPLAINGVRATGIGRTTPVLLGIGGGTIGTEVSDNPVGPVQLTKNPRETITAMRGRVFGISVQLPGVGIHPPPKAVGCDKSRAWLYVCRGAISIWALVLREKRSRLLRNFDVLRALWQPRARSAILLQTVLPALR